MTDHLAGRLLVASPSIGDPNFERTVVFLLEHGDDGALGIVLNRPTDISLPDELSEWTPLLPPPQVLFHGGPVQADALIALGHRVIDGDAPPDEFIEIAPGIGTFSLGADPLLATGELDQVRVFVGYAGWSTGQLEAEIGGDAWFVVDAEPDDVYSHDPEELWSSVLGRQPGRLAWFGNYPDEPSFN